MRSRFATSSALGAALALAIALTSTVAPAFAETPRIDLPIPAKPIHVPLGPLPKPNPDAATVTFYPDVRVNCLGKSAGNAGKVTYRFRVQNVGAASAHNVGLDTRIFQQSMPIFPSTESVATVQSGNGGTITSLLQDEEQEVKIVCTPLPGHRCDGARLNAVVADDLDPANNHAKS